MAYARIRTRSTHWEQYNQTIHYKCKATRTIKTELRFEGKKKQPHKYRSAKKLFVKLVEIEAKWLINWLEWR